MRARLRRLAPWALAVGCFFVTGLVSVAMAGPGGGGTGPAGGCPVATATSPGCVTVGAFSSATYTATGAAPQWICSATGTCELKSNITPANASTTVAAITMLAPSGLDADDLYFQIIDGGGGYVFKIDKEGDAQFVGDLTFSDALTSTTDATLLVSGAATDAVTSGAVGVFTLKAQQNITAADLLLDVQDSAGNHAFTVTEAGTATALLAVSAPSHSGGSGTSPSAMSVATGGSYCFSGTSFNSGPCLRSSGSGEINYTNNGTGVLVMGLTALTPASASLVTLGTTALPFTDLAGDASMRGTCTLNGGTPATCTATVTAAAICTCSNVGTTAAIALTGCAVSLSGTTLTITSANAASHDVNYHCIL